MPAPNIDPTKVQWDQPPAIDPTKVQWDNGAANAPPESGVDQAVRGALTVPDIAATGILNVPHAILSSALDLGRRVTGNDPNAPEPPWLQSIEAHLAPGSAQTLHEAANLPGVSDAISAVSGAAQTADRKLGEFSPTLQDIVHQTGDVARDVAMLVPAAEGTIQAGRGVADAVAAPVRSGIDWSQTGFRTQAEHPVARDVAGSSGQDALTLHNQQIGDTFAQTAAGLQPGQELGYGATRAARAAPDAVYNRVGQVLGPNPQLDQQVINEINSAGAPAGGRVTQGSPVAQQQINTLRQQLTSGLNAQGQPITGENVVNELRGLRQEGYRNIGSEDVSNQELGRAQLDMARALEGYVGRALPAGGPVSLEQLQAARTALAQNHAVEGALRGNHVDMQAIARMQRADPQLLTGPLQVIGEFANANPTISGLGSRVYAPPSWRQDVMGAPGTHRIESFISPSWWSGVGGGNALARRVLTGNTENAVARAGRMFTPRQPGDFDILPMDNLTPPPGETGVTPRQGDLGPLPEGPGPRPNLELSQPPGPVIEPQQRSVGPLPQGPGPRPTLQLSQPEGPVIEPQQRSVGALPQGPGPRPSLRLEEPLGEAFSPHQGQLPLGTPAAPAPKPTFSVSHSEDETGSHTFSSPNGELTAQENGPYLQVKRSDVAAAARGQGEGMALIEQAAQEAANRGLQLASDVSVSPDAQRLYAGLKRRGYMVVRNPAAVNKATGNLVSSDPRRPVFVVYPKDVGLGEALSGGR